METFKLNLSKQQINFLMKYFGKGVIESRMRVENSVLILPVANVNFFIDDLKSSGFKKIDRKIHYEDNPYFNYDDKFASVVGCFYSLREGFHTDEGLGYDKVTHWAYLPKPPKK